LVAEARNFDMYDLAKLVVTNVRVGTQSVGPYGIGPLAFSVSLVVHPPMPRLRGGPWPLPPVRSTNQGLKQRDAQTFDVADVTGDAPTAAHARDAPSVSVRSLAPCRAAGPGYALA
jgi:hypothetical protein